MNPTHRVDALWRIDQLVSRRSQMDFTSSGQGCPTVTKLVADGELIANAVEYVTWSDSLVQVEVCPECGCERCAPGGWIAPRFSGELLLWMPAFDAIAQSELGPDEFLPPAYVARRGIPCFGSEALAALARQIPGLVSESETRTLTRRELALGLQWTAPLRLLGDPSGAPALRREDVLAVSAGDRGDVLDDLERLIHEAMANDDAITFRPGREGSPVELHLDAPGHPSWTPLVLIDGKKKLLFGSLIAE